MNKLPAVLILSVAALTACSTPTPATPEPAQTPSSTFTFTPEPLSPPVRQTQVQAAPAATDYDVLTPQGACEALRQSSDLANTLTTFALFGEGTAYSSLSLTKQDEVATTRSALYAEGCPELV